MLKKPVQRCKIKVLGFFFSHSELFSYLFREYLSEIIESDYSKCKTPLEFKMKYQ